MNYKRFEELPCWKKARQLCQAVYEIINLPGFKKDLSLRNQIWDAAGSVMDNIAEGFDRGSNKEFLQFLFFAKGSCGELRSQLYRLRDRNYIDLSTFDLLYEKLMMIRKKISGLISYLLKSERGGYKFNEPDNEYNIE